MTLVNIDGFHRAARACLVFVSLPTCINTFGFATMVLGELRSHLIKE